MNLLIKSAVIIDANSPYHGKKSDILIENGTFKTIQPSIKAEKGYKIIESANLHVSPGWFDMQANFCDPGFEHKEDINSGTKAAAAGGFTGVAIVASTFPPLSSKSGIEYIKTKTLQNIVDVYPTGTLSHGLSGKDISEMYDMQQAGAIAFSDDKKAVADSGLLMRALLYSKNFDGLIMTSCDDRTISMDGSMNEGEASTSLGVKGIPALAEEIMVARNIHIAEYADAPLHITSISTEKSVQQIREAKAKKIKVTASVNAYNLAFDDSLLKDFDTNYKVSPPLRGKRDIEALKQGLTDGTIDVITSDHRPEDIESKKVEFDHASFGMIGLETAFALVNTYRGKLRLNQIISCLCQKPREILKIDVPLIKIGEKVNITLFDPEREWIFGEKHIQSKSHNTSLKGSKLKGTVIGIYNKKNLRLNIL